MLTVNISVVVDLYRKTLEIFERMTLTTRAVKSDPKQFWMAEA